MPTDCPLITPLQQYAPPGIWGQWSVQVPLIQVSHLPMSQFRDTQVPVFGSQVVQSGHVLAWQLLLTHTKQGLPQSIGSQVPVCELQVVQSGQVIG